jgi:hypothetical protein
VLSAGAGTFARVYVKETEGASFAGAGLTPEAVAEHFEEISDPSHAREISSGFAQADKLAASAKRIAQWRNGPGAVTRSAVILSGIRRPSVPGLLVEVTHAEAEGANAVIIACFDNTGLDAWPPPSHPFRL